MKKMKFETVQDSKRVINRLQDTIHQNFGYAAPGVYITEIHPFVNAISTKQPKVIARINFQYPRNLLDYMYRIILETNFGIHIKKVKIDYENPIHRSIGIDEFGKIFISDTDPKSHRDYSKIERIYDIAYKMADKYRKEHQK